MVMIRCFCIDCELKKGKDFCIKRKHDICINQFLVGNHGEHVVHYIAGNCKPSCGSGLPAEEQLTYKVRNS